MARVGDPAAGSYGAESLGGAQVSIAASTISLLEADPDLTDHLPTEERGLAGLVQLPLWTLDAGDVDLQVAMGQAHTFTALVLDGMLVQTLRIGEHAGLRLLGPGDLVSLTQAPPSMLVLDAELHAAVPTRLALLGSEFLVAGRRWPSLAATLHSRDTEQSERVLAQLVICQLPRVDDRLLAMLWLLAESWGRVTPDGTVVPIRLTHGVLGGLVGARRSTVTLALQELTRKGAIARHGEGWLLLEPPTAPVAGQATPHPHLHQTVARLRVERLAASDRVRKELAHIAASRKRVAGLREGISRHHVRRPTPPQPRP